MRIGQDTNSYQWNDQWAKLPPSDNAKNGWAHHGVAATGSGEVVTCHPGQPTMMLLDIEGNVKRTWDLPISDAHGITLVEEAGVESIWIADNGRKRQHGLGYEYPPADGPFAGQVVKTSLDGEVPSILAKPDIEAYREGNYSPTYAAIHEESLGGNGDVWVADGYGESYVHRFSNSGDYLNSINGEEGAGRFNCPHGIFIDLRKEEPELYVADRANHRVQVYDMEGEFKRSFGDNFLTSPSGFVTDGDLMVVAELRARLAVLDRDDNLVCYLGDNEGVGVNDGWPNGKNQTGDTVPTGLLQPGLFNSPHGMAVDRQGNLFVAEWLIGGRFVRLENLRPQG